MPLEIHYPGVALITGAAGTGIGAATAKACASSGCTRIAITDLNSDLLQTTATTIQILHPTAQIFALAGDVSSEVFVNTFVSKVVEKFGRIDYCINCAGILGNSKPSIEMSVEDFDKINSVNYRGVWLCSRAQIKAMMKQDLLEGARERGSIVNIASQLGIVSRRAAPAYCASKAAVIGLTRADAIDCSPYNIRVNALCPGMVETPMTTDAEGVPRESMKPDVEVAPLKRMGRVEEIADCALFLVSGRASFVQGSAMVVDGGYVIN